MASLWAFIDEVRGRFYYNPCGVCGRESEIWTGLSPTILTCLILTIKEFENSVPRDSPGTDHYGVSGIS